MDYKKNYLEQKKRADILEVQLLQNRYQVLIAEIKEMTEELDGINEKVKGKTESDKKDSHASKV